MRVSLILMTALLLMAACAAFLQASPAPAKPAAPLAVSDSDTLGIGAASGDDLGIGIHRSSLESNVFRRERPVYYQRSGRRDPFRPLIVDEKKTTEIHTDLLVMDGAVLTGVVWAEGHYLALVKDKDGKNFFLREGDPVYQGRVSVVTKNLAEFELSDFGDYQKVTLRVQAKDKG